MSSAEHCAWFDRANACAPAGEEVPLILGAVARFGRIGDQGQSLAWKLRRVAGELDLADKRIAQRFLGRDR